MKTISKIAAIFTFALVMSACNGAVSVGSDLGGVSIDGSGINAGSPWGGFSLGGDGLHIGPNS